MPTPSNNEHFQLPECFGFFDSDEVACQSCALREQCDIQCQKLASIKSQIEKPEDIIAFENGKEQLFSKRTVLELCLRIRRLKEDLRRKEEEFEEVQEELNLKKVEAETMMNAFLVLKNQNTTLLKALGHDPSKGQKEGLE